MLALALQRMPEKFLPKIVIGFLGEEVGRQFLAFLRTQVPELTELFKNPKIFSDLNLDQKYIVCSMLGQWLARTPSKEWSKAFSLLDTMYAEKREFFVLSIVATGKPKEVIVQLARMNRKFMKYLEELWKLSRKMKE